MSELGLEDQVWCRVHTFGKALGVHGAIAVGSKVLKSYLLNYARPLIYTTSLPAHSLVSQSVSRHLTAHNDIANSHNNPSFSLSLHLPVLIWLLGFNTQRVQAAPVTTDDD